MQDGLWVVGWWLNGLGGAKRVRCRTEVWLWHCIVVLIKNKPTELLARQKKKKKKKLAKKVKPKWATWVDKNEGGWCVWSYAGAWAKVLNIWSKAKKKKHKHTRSKLWKKIREKCSNEIKKTQRTHNRKCATICSYICKCGRLCVFAALQQHWLIATVMLWQHFDQIKVWATPNGTLNEAAELKMRIKNEEQMKLRPDLAGKCILLTTECNLQHNNQRWAQNVATAPKRN